MRIPSELLELRGQGVRVCLAGTVREGFLEGEAFGFAFDRGQMSFSYSRLPEQKL